jgi:hypothetical protein
VTEKEKGKKGIHNEGVEEDSMNMMTSYTHTHTHTCTRTHTHTYRMLVSDSGITVIITGAFCSLEDGPPVEPVSSLDASVIIST